MSKVVGVVFGLWMSILLASAQTAAHRTVLLWPNGAPGAKGDAEVDKPSLTLFPAEGSNKVSTAVVVCPGGGYVHLAMDYEGYDVAEWLNGLGISAFVLKYRLGPTYQYPVELWDAQRAIRYVRTHAAEYGVQPNRIGIWGFSAGGHLASTAGTHFENETPKEPDDVDKTSARPDFLILAYPVITLEAPYVHQGSLHALLGKDPNSELVRSLSNETQVNSRTPPTFLFHTTEDMVVPVENSVEFYLALRKAGVAAEMHVYQKGRHGVGLAQSDPILKTWPGLLADWLKVQGLR